MSKMKSFIFDLFDDNKLTINNSTQVQNAEFWTTDRDAYLSFGISRQGFVIDKAIINLYNKSDKSLLIDAPMTILNNEARFKVNSDVMSHFGKWSAQVIFNDTHTSPTVDFEILRALGSGTPDRIGLIHEWEKLNNEVKSFVAEIEGFTLDQFVELKMGEELANLETNYATRLTGLEQKDNQLTAQLAQKAHKNAIDEVNDKINSLESGIGGTYNTLSELQSKYPNGNDKRYVVLENGNWYYWNGSAWISGGSFQSVGITDEVEEAIMNKMGTHILTNKIGRMKDEDNDGIADGFRLGSDVDSYRFSNDRQYWTSEITSRASSSLQIKTEPSVKNHKYYLKFNGQSLNRVLWSGATSLGHWTTPTGITSVIFDTEEQTTPFNELRFYNRTPNVESFVEKIIFIDLTEAYGYGNEPTLEKMDSLIEEIGYFTGRTSNFDGNEISDAIAHLEEKQRLNEQVIMNDVTEIDLFFDSEFIDSNGNGRADNVTFGSTPLNSRVSNNTQYWTTSEKQNYSSSLNIKTPDVTIGHKYYISFEQRNINNILWIGPPNLSFFAGMPKEGSYVFDTTGITSPLTSLRFHTYSSSVESFVGNLIMIDLTEHFGFGNEPSAEEMDAIVNVVKDDLIKNKKAYIFNVNNINNRLITLEKNINNPSPIKDNEISMKNLKVIEPFDDSDDWTVQGGALQTVSEIDKSAYPEDFVYGYTGYIPRWGKKMLQYDVSQNSHFHKPLDTFSLDIDVEKPLVSYFYDDTGLTREGISEKFEIRLHSEYPNINDHYFTAPGAEASLSTIPGKWEYRTSGYERVGTPNPEKINGISVHVTTAKPIRLYFGGLYKYNRQNQKGAILLDFDDSLKSFYTEAFAYMSTKGLRGNVSVIGSAVDAGSHVGLPVMTIDEHVNMQAAGWSLMNHTYDNVPAFGTEKMIYGRIEKGDKWMKENGMNPLGLVPPGNGVNRLTSHVANKFYNISRGQGSYVSYFPQPDLMNIGSIELNESSSFDLWKSRLRLIETDKHVRSFHFHEIGYEGYGYMTPEKFKQFIDEIEKYDIQVLTYGDILNGKWE